MNAKGVEEVVADKGKSPSRHEISTTTLQRHSMFCMETGLVATVGTYHLPWSLTEWH